MGNSLKTKRYILCGATGDLGKAIEESLKLEGAEVIGLSTSKEDPVRLDDPAQVQACFQRIYKDVGAVDGLILATGNLHVKAFKDLTLEEIQESIEANLLSYLYPIHYAQIKKGGHILAFSSSSYLKGRGGIALYAALKASIANLIQGLAEESPDYYINAIAPSRCKGRMRKKAFPEEDEQYLLDPADVAQKAVEILKSQFTGLVVDVRKDQSFNSMIQAPSPKAPCKAPCFV